MAVTKKKDKYVNVLNGSLALSATDTLTFEEIVIGLNIFDKVGILIHQMRIDFDSTTIRGLVASTDSVEFGLTTSNQVTSLNMSNQAVIDRVRYMAVASGTPANTLIYETPKIVDYTMLPEGGLLVAPKPLYMAGDSAGMGAASTYQVRLYFTIIPLADSDYFELLESRQFFG